MWYNLNDGGELCCVFPNSLIDEAVSLIKDKLHYDKNLDKRTCLSTGSICSAASKWDLSIAGISAVATLLQSVMLACRQAFYFI